MTISSMIRSIREKPYQNIFFALLVVILFDALAPNALSRGLFADLTVAALLTAALLETVRSRHNAIWAAILGVPAIGVRFLAAFTDDSVMKNSTILALTAVFVAFLVWNLLHDLARGDRPTSERVFGALCAYVFIGLLFALVFAHLEFRNPGSFAMSNPGLTASASSEATLVPTFVYFSFVTMTTLGYGDITPVTEHARTLAWLEALIGQLYLAVMVAGFVAVHISKSMRDRRDDPTNPSKTED
jgi:voltage-gated potassium channel Kch